LWPRRHHPHPGWHPRGGIVEVDGLAGLRGDLGDGLGLASQDLGLERGQLQAEHLAADGLGGRFQRPGRDGLRRVRLVLAREPADQAAGAGSEQLRITSTSIG
jgi:hypothetical protein